MSDALSELRAAAFADDSAALARCPVPERYLAAVVRAEDEGRPAGADVRDIIHLQEVPTPEPGPGEVLVASLASSINYNTVWTATFQPVSTFRFLRTYGRTSALAARHDLPYHVLGSDLAGVVLRTGVGVSRWHPGDEVVVHCLAADMEAPDGHDDSLLDPGQRIWGYENNFGGLAELALVKATQLMPKAAHLTWEEAASANLVLSTAYRQLVSPHGAGMKQGDKVLIWGACGGLGAYATQLALNGGAVPVCVVSSPGKAELCRRMGAELVIDRCAERFEFWDGANSPRMGELSRFRQRVADLLGGLPDIVFEHPGRDTFAASVLTAARGGAVVTCASTTGYDHRYDNRHLWMNVKRIIGTHSANYREAWASNDLTVRGRIHPVLSRTYPLAAVGEAVSAVQANVHLGKVGVRCLAPEDGLGIRNHAMRVRHLDRIRLFRTRS